MKYFRKRAWNFYKMVYKAFVIRFIHSWEIALTSQIFNNDKKGSGTEKVKQSYSP